ncbi:MAG: ligand-gated channel protein, partial [Alphaproteobacteria bacterium]|nr:ligand-gated channel protein [Alphaproteobacteria bacterium]
MSTALPLGVALALAIPAGPAGAQTGAPGTRNAGPLEPVVVSPPKRKGTPRAGQNAPGAAKRARRTPTRTVSRPTPPPTPPDDTTARTPLNSNGVASVASRLGLTVRQTPATVEIVDQSQMREQGYRTTTEAA